MLIDVFNHTTEGNENGLILSFRGVDNGVYYMLAPTVRLLVILCIMYYIYNFLYKKVIFYSFLKLNHNFCLVIKFITNVH